MERKKPSQAQIKDLKARVGDCEVKLRAARQALDEALCDALDYRRGDIIQSKTGELAKVVHLYVRNDIGRIDAVMKKKDGTWGERLVSLWRHEWDDPQIVGHEPDSEP